MSTQSIPKSLFGDSTPVIIPPHLVAAAPTAIAVMGAKLDPNSLALVQSHQLTTLPSDVVVLFGSDLQKKTSETFDKLLAQITKGESPILFELFKQLQKGIKDTNLSELEEEIKKSQGKSAFSSIMDSIGLSSVAKRLQAANERIGSLLTSKSENLLTMTKEMENKLNTEVLKLIDDSKLMEQLAQEFRSNVQQYKIWVDAGRQILSDAKAILVQKQQVAANGDPLAIEDVKVFEQKIQLFESRVLVLETILAEAPVELEAIRLQQGAGYQVLAETASSSLSDFNRIKSALMKISVSHKISSVATMNTERKALSDSLNKHSADLLGKTAEDAARAAGQNRLDDANRLLEYATNMDRIATKVKEEQKLNETRFAESRKILTQVGNLIKKTV